MTTCGMTLALFTFVYVIKLLLTTHSHKIQYYYAMLTNKNPNIVQPKILACNQH